MLDWLRIGAVRLFLAPEPTPTGPPPVPGSLANLTGETSLEDAAAQLPFTLRLPAYPPDLGQPQHVYLQRINGTPVLILAWPDAQDPTRAAWPCTRSGRVRCF